MYRLQNRIPTIRIKDEPYRSGPIILNRKIGLALSAALSLSALTLALAAHSARANENETVEAKVETLDVSPRKIGNVKIAAGKSATLRVESNFSDILVADPDIADAQPLTDHTVTIFGKKIGSTRVSVFDANKRLVGIIDAEVAYDTGRLAAEIERQMPRSGIRVSSVNGRVMLAGTAQDATTLDRALTLAKQFGSEVINQVTVKRPQQVMLEVRFVEASRTAGRELGIQWDVVAGKFAATLGAAGLVTGNIPFGTLVGNLLGKGVQAEAIIRALEEKGLARRLAEPNLVALSGDTASFLAGGEFPFPVQSTQNNITIEFKRFGVGLAFTPTVLGDGLINLKIEPEVSQLDPTNTVRVGNVSIPSLIVRRASTTVELKDGQSFAIAGLLQSTSSTTAEQFPWIGEVPVIGALFRSAAFQKSETDLAIIVTPRLVRPAIPGERLRTPFDNALPANDADYFLLGRSEVTPGQARKIAGVSRPLSGHIIDLPGSNAHVTR